MGSKWSNISPQLPACQSRSDVSHQYGGTDSQGESSGTWERGVGCVFHVSLQQNCFRVTVLLHVGAFPCEGEIAIGFCTTRVTDVVCLVRHASIYIQALNGCWVVYLVLVVVVMLQPPRSPPPPPGLLRILRFCVHLEDYVFVQAMIFLFVSTLYFFCNSFVSFAGCFS